MTVEDYLHLSYDATMNPYVAPTPLEKDVSVSLLGTCTDTCDYI